ncbi:D-alanyl-D-alanine carboxypeptidase family protein [Neobacillus sp.]|uniref:D-alanyl-D-alanine carboxypeptidase family protein n=1 Tax=Neobacillus sp. TaxID=2675273 RepID=UPI0035B52774
MKKIFIILISYLLIFMVQPKVSAEEIQQLNIKSEAAALLDTDTNAVLYTKNADAKMYPASLTKIATAIYAIEKGDLNSIAVVSANAVRQDGTRVYLVEGEQVPLKKLIQGMLINSGNDAAVAIAEHLDGSVEKFSENINEYLKKKIGVNHTHFTNPSGLFDENHYTTAMDLALITNYAVKNPVFAEIFGAKELVWTGQAWNTTIKSHHLMVTGDFPYPEVTGGKTGYTSLSKQTLATTADNGELKLTAVVLKSDHKRDKYDDTSVLFDFGFKDFQHTTLPKGQIFKNGTKEFYPEKDVLITEGISGSTKKVNSDGVLSVVRNNGQVIQTVQLKLNEPETENVAKMEMKSTKQKQDVSLKDKYLFIGILIFFIAALGVVVGRKWTRKL